MTRMANTEQREFWSGPSGLSWIEDADIMDSIFSGVVELLRGRAGDVAGKDVLDLGCGTGAVSRSFAEAGARVMASDISAPMLAEAERRGAGRFETLLGDAQVAQWPWQFDLITSRFGVMFFEDPSAAFENIAKALKPGGRIVFAAWGPFERNVWWVRQRDLACEVLGVSPEQRDPHAPGPMGLSDMSWALDKMAVPGLVNVACEPVEIVMTFQGDAELVAQQALRIGSGAKLLNAHGATDVQRKAYAAKIVDAFREFETEGRTLVPAHLNLFTAEAE